MIAEKTSSNASDQLAKALLWALVIAAPLISLAIIGAVTGTSLLRLDGWSTDWNDELRYFWSTTQMRLFGHPTGVTGYNEVAAQLPSYGPYPVSVYALYYLGSLFTGIDGHNFLYAINVVLGMLAAAAIVVVLRPDKPTSICLAVLIGLQFIVARYIGSGMTEANYVLFAALFASCALYMHKVCDQPGKEGRFVAAYCAAVLSIAFWGSMRPYLIAFALVPVCLLLVGRNGVNAKGRAALIAVTVVVMGAVMYWYLWQSKYALTPYFYKATIANSMLERIVGALPGLPLAHVKCVLFSGKKLVMLQWQGIMVFAFFISWVVLLVRCVAASRSGDKPTCVLLATLIVVGFVVFEAHLMIYDYKHMHRTMMAVVVVYLVAIAFLDSGRVLGGRFSVRSAVVLAVSLLCAASLAVKPGEFSLPQVPDGYDVAQEQAERDELERLLPYDASNEWNNTVAHPPENSGIRIYFNLPRHTNMNTCKKEYLEKAMAEGTLKSKYLCLPAKGSLNKLAAKRYTKLYEGSGHVIYATR